jgi:hypothetical protein
MDLSEQQKQTIRDWVAAGASLSDVQRNLKADLGITMTYMDVRMLVLDLGASVKDKPEVKPPKAKAIPAPQPMHSEEDSPEYDLDEGGATDTEALHHEDSDPGEQQAPDSTVTLVMDSLVVPGAMVSGSVTFSDGTKARWLIDQYGRFGIEPETPGYRPSPEDMNDFQMQLRGELHRKGYM